MTLSPELIEWVEKEAERIEYGQVGFVLTLHQGKVVKVKKVSEHDQKVGKAFNGVDHE